MKFLISPDFEYMIACLKYKSIPRSGNLEIPLKTWRLMEKIRYGIKTERGRQNHLKLYQLKHNLNNLCAENSGKTPAMGII
jgi:hypothetical protein